MTSLINRYAREKGLLKEKDDNLTGDDIREGLTAVISIKLGEPQFEGQTKTKLGNTEAKTFVQRVVNDQLGNWLESHRTRRATSSASPSRRPPRGWRRARRARRPGARAARVGRHAGQAAGLPVDKPAECEVFIVEGDSAGGSAVRGRNPHTQAILPIRGKILNVERARLDRALGNQEVQALITAFGTGIGEDFDLSKLRYHKIVLMADADVDGQHICTLLLTLLFRYMRPLIEHGHVFLAQPPLYRIKWSNAEHDYVYSDRGARCFPVRGLASGKRIPKDGGLQRYKGWGRWTTPSCGRPRWTLAAHLLQVTMDDAAAADEIFAILMGEDVESRRASSSTTPRTCGSSTSDMQVKGTTHSGGPGPARTRRECGSRQKDEVDGDDQTPGFQRRRAGRRG